ncbi:hypothetical protein GYMLUDRAFT_265409 [Collybiopsis luxurians FD-317 M1]|uniref:Uncharacterized protein n=1 Tax=Collybiopsis luxurians FD-317 M1 TaxID=944289 RepID=A0A0D0AQC8_9AGAR|nr:hypothetical protein GYMLUDRAFT_265409 [Collybiopsis luxurians FD-317 M1]
MISITLEMILGHDTGDTTLFSTADLFQLQESLPVVLGASPHPIRPFEARRIYSDNLFQKPRDSRTVPESFDQQRECITVRGLSIFPQESERGSIRVLLFVPAPLELYPPGLHFPVYDQEGTYVSGWEFFVCWGLWVLEMDTTYVGSLEQWNLMPPLAKTPLEQFYQYYGIPKSLQYPEQHLVRYTLKRLKF